MPELVGHDSRCAHVLYGTVAGNRTSFPPGPCPLIFGRRPFIGYVVIRCEPRRIFKDHYHIPLVVAAGPCNTLDTGVAGATPLGGIVGGCGRGVVLVVVRLDGDGVVVVASRADIETLAQSADLDVPRPNCRNDRVLDGGGRYVAQHVADVVVVLVSPTLRLECRIAWTRGFRTCARAVESADGERVSGTWVQPVCQNADGRSHVLGGGDIRPCIALDLDLSDGDGVVSRQDSKTVRVRRRPHEVGVRTLNVCRPVDFESPPANCGKDL